MARSKKPVAFKAEKVAGSGPPDGPWIWLSGDLLSSDAWRFRSINCVRLIEALLVDHMAHAGQENGNLKATYGQLRARGCPQRLIVKAIHEAEERGLIGVTRHHYRQGSDSHPNLYRLTFYSTKDKDEFGREIWRAATNEWRRYSEPARVKNSFRAAQKVVTPYHKR